MCQEDSNQGEPSSGDGLAAAAAEYERSHARPPPPTAHFTITGEEGEINVMQVPVMITTLFLHYKLIQVHYFVK